MKNIIFFLSLFFAAFIITSCDSRRDDNGDLLFGLNPIDNNGNNPNPSATRLLKKIISHEKDEDTGEWVDSELILNYIDKKLVSYDDGSGSLTKFDYNSSNKISKIYNDGLVSILEYSGNNVSKLNTKLTGIGDITSTYTYTSGKLSKVVSIQEYTIPIPMKIYLEANYQYTGENITKEIIKNGVYLPDGTLQMNDAEEQAFVFSYDNKKSPYKLLPVEFGLWLAGVGPQGGAFLSTNNIKSQTVTIGTLVAPAITYNHEYDSEDYLVKSTGDDGETLKYEYQK